MAQKFLSPGKSHTYDDRDRRHSGWSALRFFDRREYRFDGVCVEMPDQRFKLGERERHWHTAADETPRRHVDHQTGPAGGDDLTGTILFVERQKRGPVRCRPHLMRHGVEQGRGGVPLDDDVQRAAIRANEGHRGNSEVAAKIADIGPAAQRPFSAQQRKHKLAKSL